MEGAFCTACQDRTLPKAQEIALIRFVLEPLKRKKRKIPLFTCFRILHPVLAPSLSLVSGASRRLWEQGAVQKGT